MRALQVTELSGPDAIRLHDVSEPVDASRVLVSVRAVGLSFPDVLRSRGLYQERTEPPFTLGSELAGVVISAPEKSGVRPGDRVAAMGPGAAAEIAAVQPDEVISLPAHVTFEAGAALPLNYRTAVLGLEIRGRMQPRETVLVHGAGGGTGTAAIQVAKAAQCRVIALVSSELKEQTARAAGADVVLRTDDGWKDRVLEVTDGAGVDIVWDPVGGDRVLDTMRVLRPGGRWVVIGFVGGPIPNVPLNRVLLRNIDIVGTYIGGYLAKHPEATRSINARLVELLRDSAIQPVVGDTYPFERGADALRKIEARDAVGKVVLTLD